MTPFIAVKAKDNETNKPVQEQNSIERRNEANQDENQETASDIDDLENTYDENQIIESDSSYYSVNKFNILFYFVYKLKYGEEEDSQTED